jgi:transcriptional regulator with XRE-family HTH domain
MNPVAGQFGDNLRYCRRKAKLSQEDLGFGASLHRTEVGLLERGARVPRIDTLMKLAGALSIAPEELLDGIDWQPGSRRPGGFGIASPEPDAARREGG